MLGNTTMAATDSQDIKGILFPETSGQNSDAMLPNIARQSQPTKFIDSIIEEDEVAMSKPTPAGQNASYYGSQGQFPDIF